MKRHPAPASATEYLRLTLTPQPFSRATHGLSPNQRASPRQAFVPSDRPGPGPVRQCARRAVAGLDRQDRFRRLGRSQLGAGPGPLRRRRRRRSLRRRARGQGQEAGAGNLLHRRALARPGPGRRAERQDAAVPGRRIASKLTPSGGQPATSRRAPTPTSCRTTWPRSPAARPARRW